MKLSLFAIWILATANACGSKEAKDDGAGSAAGKLSKLDVKITVDSKGRIKPMLQLLDQKLKPVIVTGSYSISIARADGTELCKLDGTFAPTDFADTKSYRAGYHDAGCPAEPGADELKVMVKVESPDKTIERTLSLPSRMVFESWKPPVPPMGSAGSGSAGSGSAGSGSAGSGSAASGSAGSAAGSGSAKPGVKVESGPG